MKNMKSLGGRVRSLGFTLAEVLMTKRTSGMENTILHSRESETKEPSVNIIKRCAFTLAEVLITLAVIGVVAALTIPTVVHKYQQKQMYTQFMKVYNTLSNAVQLSIADNGSISTWDYSEPNKMFDKYFSEYLKVINTKPLPDYDLHDLSGATIASLSAAVIGGSEGTNSDDMYYFGDGSSCAIAVAVDEYGIDFICDTNGDKAPNTAGKDIFTLLIDVENDLFVPQYKAGDNNEACSVDGNGGEAHLKGLGCADRLLREGKMDY